MSSYLYSLPLIQCKECHIDIPYLFPVGSPLYVHDWIFLPSLLVKPLLRTLYICRQGVLFCKLSVLIILIVALSALLVLSIIIAVQSSSSIVTLFFQVSIV